MNELMLRRPMLFILTITLILFAFAGLVPAQEATTVTLERDIPFVRTVTDACTERGKGIRLTGSINSQFEITRDFSGFNLKGQFNAEGVAGESFAGGTKYLADGMSRFNYSGRSLPLRFSHVSNFLLTTEDEQTDGQMVHVTVLITVRANNDVNIEVRNVKVSCNR